MWLVRTLQTTRPDPTHQPQISMLIELVVQCAYHHPLSRWAAQLKPRAESLSLSGVLNCLRLALYCLRGVTARASPASPLYPDTVSRYLPASSLMEKLEYSAAYHRPFLRRIYQTFTRAAYVTGRPESRIKLCRFWQFGRTETTARRRRSLEEDIYLTQINNNHGNRCWNYCCIHNSNKYDILR